MIGRLGPSDAIDRLVSCPLAGELVPPDLTASARRSEVAVALPNHR